MIPTCTISSAHSAMCAPGEVRRVEAGDEGEGDKFISTLVGLMALAANRRAAMGNPRQVEGK